MSRTSHKSFLPGVYYRLPKNQLLRLPIRWSRTCQILRIDPQSHDEIRPDYVDRINRGIDQIVQHLDSPLKLDQVSTESEVSRDSRLEQSALDWLYGTWLPESGHEPDDLPCFEAWYGHPFGHGFEHFELSVQLPVRQ